MPPGGHDAMIRQESKELSRQIPRRERETGFEARGTSFRLLSGSCKSLGPDLGKNPISAQGPAGLRLKPIPLPWMRSILLYSTDDSLLIEVE